MIDHAIEQARRSWRLYGQKNLRKTRLGVRCVLRLSVSNLARLAGFTTSNEPRPVPRLAYLKMRLAQRESAFRFVFCACTTGPTTSLNLRRERNGLVAEGGTGARVNSVLTTQKVAARVRSKCPDASQRRRRERAQAFLARRPATDFCPRASGVQVGAYRAFG